MKRALITGISGQDGAYLAAFLIGKGYQVIGTSRDADKTSFTNLEALGIDQRVVKVSMTPSSISSVLRVVEDAVPDEIYNLSAQSSVGLSFEIPGETFQSIVSGTLCILDAVRTTRRPVRVFSSGSGECFGDTGEARADETAPFRPQSPYGAAKAAAHNLVAAYRQAHGVFACTGITFNHESPLRPARYVTQKIVQGAARIANAELDSLQLGNLDVERDWGWAPEYVEVMWRMLQQTAPADYIIATGRSVSLRHFAERAFAYFGIDWQRFVHTDSTLQRPSEILYSRANPSRASREMGWVSAVDMETVVDRMCDEAVRTRIPTARVAESPARQ